MDEPFLVVVSLTMFVGSYLAGCIPLFFTLNERRIRIVSVFGAGLLIGTALCVIIPEGVATLIESYQHQNTLHNSEIIQQPHIYNADDAKLPADNVQKQRNKRNNQQSDSFLAVIQASMSRVKTNLNNDNVNDFTKEANGKNVMKREITAIEGNARNNPQYDKHEDHTTANLDHPIGISLLVGFLFMFLIDQISKMTHSRHKNLSTLALVIHSFADGIAMGSAASADSQMEMQIIVFAAIMLHKAPAAFALVSILLAHGFEKPRIRRHLLIFSLAAPIATILTYAFLHTAQYDGDSFLFKDGAQIDNSVNTTPKLTGVILLFSAGTFLYVATVHVLPELIESKCASQISLDGSRELLLVGGHTSGLAGSNSRFSIFEMLLFCISAMTPALISFFSHGHH